MSKPLAAALPQPYDFRRPTTLAREHSRVLEAAFDGFARQLATLLGARFHTKVQVTCESVHLSTYSQYTASLPSSTVMVLCKIDDLEPRMVAQVPHRTAIGWVSQMLGGGPLSTEEDVEAHKLTPTDADLVTSVVQAMNVDLAYSLSGSLNTEPVVDAIQFNSQFAQAAAPADLMVIATILLSSVAGEETMTFAIPGEALLPNLGETNPLDPAEGIRDRITIALSEVPVEVTLSLKPARVTPPEAMGWTVGDLIRLPHAAHEPMRVLVGDKAYGSGIPATRGARQALKITTTKEA